MCCESDSSGRVKHWRKRSPGMNGIARKVTPVEEVNVIPADQADNRIDIGMRGGEVGSRRIRRQRSTARRDMLIVKVANFLELMAKGVGR
jgi:hypothetical protein